MSRKSTTPGAGKAKDRLHWRPANALNASATSRAAWSKGGGKRGKNPRSKKAKSPS
jgi:hypothetical protein